MKANALDTGRIHHAYLFTGTRGVGKNDIGAHSGQGAQLRDWGNLQPVRQMRRVHGDRCGPICGSPEVDAATNTKVDEMRELLETAQYAPVAAATRCTSSTKSTCFRKRVQRNVENAESHRVMWSFNGHHRSAEVAHHRVVALFAIQLEEFASAVDCRAFGQSAGCEGVAFDTPALDMIGRAGEGSARDSLSLLDQAIAHGAGEVRNANVAEMLGRLTRPICTTCLTLSRREMQRAARRN